MEGQIDHKAVKLFNNICRQDNRSTEKQLAYRQLLLKGESKVFLHKVRILCIDFMMMMMMMMMMMKMMMMMLMMMMMMMKMVF